MSFLQKKAELKEFWIDYFKFEIDWGFWKKIPLFALSNNSDFFNYDSDTRFQLVENSTYDTYVWIIDNSTLIRLGFFLINKKPKKNGENYLKNYIEITGQGLILHHIEYYYNMINKLKFKVTRVERVDIATDYITNTHELCTNIFLPKLEKISKHIFETKWVIETLYIGKKDKKKNPYQLIRIYNKKLDTDVRNKGFLYDFDKKKDYTRIELEIRQDKARYINYLDLLSQEYCFTIFAKSIHKFSYDFFKKFSYDDYKNFSKLIKGKSSLYYDRKAKIEQKIVNFEKYWKEFFSVEEEKDYLRNTLIKCKKLEKNKYSFSRFLWNLKTFWVFTKEIEEFFSKNDEKI